MRHGHFSRNHIFPLYMLHNYYLCNIKIEKMICREKRKKILQKLGESLQSDIIADGQGTSRSRRWVCRLDGVSRQMENQTVMHSSRDPKRRRKLEITARVIV